MRPVLVEEQLQGRHASPKSREVVPGCPSLPEARPVSCFAWPCDPLVRCVAHPPPGLWNREVLMRSILLWLIGVPIPIIILIALLT